MMYYYDMKVEVDHEPNKYWTMEEVKQIPLYPFSDETKKLAMAENSTLWPVHDPCGWSFEHVNCKDEEEAYRHLLDSFNLSIYEALNDI